MAECPHCYESIDTRATRCNHCSGKIVIHSEIKAYARTHGVTAAKKKLAREKHITIVTGMLLFGGITYWLTGNLIYTVISSVVIGYPFGWFSFVSKITNDTMRTKG
jgi:hypothetical protein